jgi:8-oxo-dGTP pyrophosphatase MutT (NUDIX family)
MVDVKARALVVLDGCVAFTRQRRRDRPYNALPGGRVKPGEGVLEALVRELREEVDVELEPGRLVYIAEVLAPGVIQDLNLVFLASVAGIDESERLELIEPGSGRPVFPPLLGQIAADLLDGFARAPRWLGNVWDPALLRVREP